MRLMTFSIAGVTCAAALFASPAANSANAPLCLAIAQNYNNCIRQSQFGGIYRGGYGHGYPGGPYGDDEGYDGYGGGGGYGPGYGGYGRGYGGNGGYRGQGPGRARAACAVWVAQMQASGCFN